MGKGDQRSRRGKIWRGTFGKRRPKKLVTTTKVSAAAEVSTEPAAKPAARVKIVEKEKEKEKQPQSPEE